MKVRDILSLIKDDGRVQVRQRGSHRQFQHPNRPGGLTVAGHPSRDLPEWIVNSIMKQAGIDWRKK